MKKIRIKRETYEMLCHKKYGRKNSRKIVILQRDHIPSKEYLSSGLAFSSLS